MGDRSAPRSRAWRLRTNKKKSAEKALHNKNKRSRKNDLQTKGVRETD